MQLSNPQYHQPLKATVTWRLPFKEERQCLASLLNPSKENDSVGRVGCLSLAKITTPVANAATALMRKAHSSKRTSPTALPSAAVSSPSGPPSGPSPTTQAETLRKARNNQCFEKQALHSKLPQ